MKLEFSLRRLETRTVTLSTALKKKKIISFIWFVKTVLKMYFFIITVRWVLKIIVLITTKHLHNPLNLIFLWLLFAHVILFHSELMPNSFLMTCFDKLHDQWRFPGKIFVIHHQTFVCLFEDISTEACWRGGAVTAKPLRLRRKEDAEYSFN